MKLYTSLVRLKQSMNGGQLPPMTPVSGAALDIIDPEFTIGMGALREDPALGLQCPVRGCGRYLHALGKHLSTRHKGIGGARAVRAALSIPWSAPLISASALETMRLANERARAEGRIPTTTTHIRPEQRRKVRRGSRVTVGMLNLKDRCAAQLSHKLIDLHHTNGRSPSIEEFQAAYGVGMYEAVRQVYGTFNNAKAVCGLEVHLADRRPGHHERRRERVVEGLKAWYDAHRSLPTLTDVRRPGRAPLIPSDDVVLSAMQTRSWPEAMRRAAAILDIRGGRYGLPERDAA